MSSCLCNKNLKNIPNPVGVCQELYGIQNVNDVRDCILDSIRRFYGVMCDFHAKNLYYTVQSYLVKVLQDAGRNPLAVKLPFSPGRLQADFFVQRYIQSNYDKEKALQLCLIDCDQLPQGQSQQCKINCYVDSKSI